jgi:hypothetical protein
MLRVVQYKTYRHLTAEELMQAIEIAQELQKAFENLEGVRFCKLGMGRGTLAYVVDLENYASVDNAFTDSAVQSTLGKLVLEFGYLEASVETFYDLEQVFPFINK